VETRTVGPTLAKTPYQKSLLAGIIGFIIVILSWQFIIAYWFNGRHIDHQFTAVITFAIFRYIPVTLTLPGFAGLMLSTGSALDANILIFERIKEELRAGKVLRQAVDLGFLVLGHLFRDSNIATLITSFHPVLVRQRLWCHNS